MADCLWCGIAAGKIQSIKVYEDDSFIAVLDINPANPGQVVVTTKKHAKDIRELSPSETGKLFSIVRSVTIALTQSLGCEGVNAVYSLGTLAGQRSDHLIVYVVPRFKDDKVIINWEPKQVEPEKLVALGAKVAEAIKSVPVVVSAPQPKVIHEKIVDEKVIKRKPRVPVY
ncbi:MAG: HIT family protein [Candidatus Nanoarchaeia archaeon]|jgi:histidine triad (HIT) family protein